MESVAKRRKGAGGELQRPWCFGLSRSLLLNENYVVKEHLTDRMIDAGADVTRRLVESGGPVDAV